MRDTSARSIRVRKPSWWTPEQYALFQGLGGDKTATQTVNALHVAGFAIDRDSLRGRYREMWDVPRLGPLGLFRVACYLFDE